MVWLGILLALGTSVSWAIGNVLTQRVGRLVGPPRAMLWSMAAGAVLAAPCSLLFDARQAPLTSSVAIWIAAAAVAGVFAYVGLFFAFANEGLTLAVPVVSSWPLVAGVVSVALLGDALRGVQLLGAAAVVIGVVLVAVPRRDAAATTTTTAVAAGSEPASTSTITGKKWAMRAALASAVGFGVMVPAMAHVAPATGAFGATVIVFVLGIMLALGIGRLAGVSLRAPPRAAFGLVFATGAVETMGFVTVALARRFAPMTVVAPVASLASTLTVLYAWMILKERPSRTAIAGALLAGAGVVVLAS
ncbi:MAG: EamA-like transporter family [Myxococcales bacterium]|jgi:drug/metabolite transporter (DMT)-like permease|nr:EamA-like transporter family [Myxococcales bacterium]